MTGNISIVATPIGNLEDLSPRALRTLTEVDLVLCEDTRVSAKLLNAFGIKKPLVSVHQHSTDAKLQALVEEISQGKRVAYVCDAGTPGMNDPGGKLVELAFQAHIPVVPIPGASALTLAISVCGFPMDEFTYVGFAPHKKGRQTFFSEIAARSTPTVFLESTHRIMKAFEQLEEVLPPGRLVFVGRELTKLHETLYRGAIKDVREAIQQTSTKGEFILIIGPQPK